MVKIRKKFSKFETELLERLDKISELVNLLVKLSVPPLNIEGLKLGKQKKPF